MRSAALAFAAVLGAGVVVLFAFAALERRDEAFTLGVAPGAVLEAPAGKSICQRPIDVPVAFRAVRVNLAIAGARGRVAVRDARTGEPLGSGVGRTRPSTVMEVRLGRDVPEGRRVEVCVRDAGGGGGKLVVLGNATAASRSSDAWVGGRPFGADLTMVFVRSESRTLLASAGDIMSRAALFHGSWVGTWSIALLAGLLLTAFPALLLVALRAAVRASGPK